MLPAIPKLSPAESPRGRLAPECPASGDADLLTGGGGGPFVGSQDPAEVQRVGGGDGHLRRLPAAADGAQQRDGLGERVLLAVETGNEAASADLAAGFEGAADAREVAPGDRELFACEGL